MQDTAFRDYLLDTGLYDRVRPNYLLCCRHIEKYCGNIDIFFDNNKLDIIIKRLASDCIPIHGDRSRGVSSLKTALRKYKNFREWQRGAASKGMLL